MSRPIGVVKFYNDGVDQAVTFGYLIYTDEFPVQFVMCYRAYNRSTSVNVNGRSL